MPLECRNLSFGFAPGRAVLREVTIAFAPGRLTAIIGPNGSGKTTLLRLLLGVLTPGAGAVTLDGAGTASLRGQDRAARIAYLAQRTTVWAAFTVRQVVAMGRHALPHAPVALDSALRDADLLDRADEPFHAQSAGQQQRAAMARALAQLHPAQPDPVAGTRCLLADEPIASMDPAHALWAMQRLAALARAGITVVAVLHDFGLAARFADDALVLSHDGRLAATGPAQEVLTPQVLGPVFGVRFDRIRTESGWLVVPGASPRG